MLSLSCQRHVEVDDLAVAVKVLSQILLTNLNWNFVHEDSVCESLFGRCHDWLERESIVRVIKALNLYVSISEFKLRKTEFKNTEVDCS